MSSKTLDLGFEDFVPSASLGKRCLLGYAATWRVPLAVFSLLASRQARYIDVEQGRSDRTQGNIAVIRSSSVIIEASARSGAQKVEVREQDGKLIIEPMSEPGCTLDALLAGMKAETYYGIVDFGSPLAMRFLNPSVEVPDTSDCLGPV